MSTIGSSIFETIFKQSLAPMAIFQANAPVFTLLEQNMEHRLATLTTGKDMAGKSAYEVFITYQDNEESRYAYNLMIKAFKECLDRKVIVKLPPLKSRIGQWGQTEVVPVTGKDDTIEFLITTSYDISKQVLLEDANTDGKVREKFLSEELASSNEELSATNEELSSMNEELRQSQESLFDINRELEERVQQRTQALSESEARFRTMVEQSPVPMLVTMGKAMIFEIINQPMLELIGKDESVIGKPWDDAMPELEGQDIISQLLETYDSGKSWSGDEVPIMIYKKGKPVLGFYNITYKPLIEKGQIIGMLQSAIDVTELVKTRLQQQTVNEELAAANEELAAINEELHKSNEEIIQTQNSLQNMIVELAESEDRFRNMAESTEVLIAVADENSNGIYFNRAWTILTGKSEDELLEFGWAELIHPDDKDRWLSNYLAAAERKEAVHGEFRILSKSGEYRWLLANIPARFRPDGSFAGYVSSCIDITTRKTNEQQLAQIISMLPAAVVVINGPELIVETVNDANLAYWNKSKAEVIGKPLLEILPELASQAFPGQLKQVMETGEIVDVKESPVLFYNADGTKRETFVDYTYQPLTDSTGKRSSVLVMSFEITDRVLSRRLLEQFSDEMQSMNEELTASNEELAAVNEELLKARENLQMATESGELATWYLDEKLGQVIASARFNELFGFYPDEEVSFTAALNQIVPEFQATVQNALKASFNSGANFKVEFQIIGRHDGKQRWIRSVGKFVADDKSSNYITGIMADITEQKMDDIRKNDFIGMVSHELKTPLTSLSGYLQLLKRKSENVTDNFTINALEQSVKQVGKMTTMINGFLNVTRLESGKINIDKRQFDMADLVKECESETILLNTTHTFIFHPVIPTIVLADRDKIGQVINNLISNAAKYSQTGTTIQVACLTINGCAQVSVRDEGMGIDPQHLSHLFQRYYRVDNASHISGFGIGLYLSSEIIERHEGKIWVESEQGKGSTFYFSIPII